MHKSASLSHPKLSRSSSKKKSRWLGTELDAVDGHDLLSTSSHPLHSTTYCWNMPSCQFNQSSDFLNTICQVLSSHARVGMPMFCLRQGPNDYPHQILLASQIHCLGCGCCCMLIATSSHWWELGTMWRTKVEELSMRKWLSPLEVLLCHGTLYTQISW